jgi:hypothetical protein
MIVMSRLMKRIKTIIISEEIIVFIIIDLMETTIL